MKEINWKTINAAEAECLFKNLDFENLFVNTDELGADYAELRARLRDEYEKYVQTSDDLEYGFDLNFGLKLYHILGAEYKFTVSDASNPGVWRDLMLCVIPDIAAKRIKNKSSSDPWIGDKKKTRIWLFRIWWYIHLSWQGTEEETREILKNNTADAIQAIVERPGQKGYRVELLRKIMKKCSECSGDKRKILRAAMVRNSAWLLSQEPALADGGIPGYTETLFETKEK